LRGLSAKRNCSPHHPNIAQIYGVVGAASLDDAGVASEARRGAAVHGLVMELVEGPTLADRIKEGPIPVNEALAIARQIAAALEAAHDQGIIHRDLKPANIKVDHEGIGVQPYPGPGEKVRVSTSGGGEPLWSRNGRELFYRSSTSDRQQFLSAPVTSVSPFRTDTPRVLFESTTFEYDSTVPIRSWDVSPDGRFLLLRYAPSADKPVTSMQIVLNCTEELKRRAPER
jgi:serine/threonine protein kinase